MPCEPKGAIATLRSFLKARPPKKRIGMREQAGNVEVSTVFVNDLECWETAIVHDGHASPVERYDTEDEAVRGHERWVFEVPYMSEITKLGYGDMIPPRKIRLR